MYGRQSTLQKPKGIKGKSGQARRLPCATIWLCHAVDSGALGGTIARAE
jgi:hypothetical protein